jgi:Homeodomain
LSYANVAATTNDPNKQRSTVSEEQRQILLKIFNGNHHPDRDTQMGLAVELGLPVSIISNFFLNARRRLRYSYNRGGGNSNCIKRV